MSFQIMGLLRYRFGLFEFDAAKLELRREGTLVRLQAQPAQALACLVARAGEVVSREDLQQAVWGEQTFVDFEGGLNFCISQLRSALQDNSAQPVFIRTVPKNGYQFIAPVARVAQAAQEPPREARERFNKRLALWMGAVAVSLVGVVGGMSLLMYFYLLPGSARNVPILAVVRFDNETGDPAVAKFSDELTDNVVVQLTAQSRGSYRVIGNSQILRLPREQRDLKAIVASLNADYVVLGQVQTNGDQVRILAHLIRTSDQTHIWVVRQDRRLNDRLSLEAEAAQKISSEFSAQMSADPGHAASFPAGTR
jgi:DNA-binding winged helix-turn-helix (wHTH) protein/TolB-like protein